MLQVVVRRRQVFKIVARAMVRASRRTRAWARAGTVTVLSNREDKGVAGFEVGF